MQPINAVDSWLTRAIFVLSLCLALERCCLAQAPANFKKAGNGDATKLPLDKAIDLLAMVKLPDHNMQGIWKQHDGALVCEASPAGAKFMVPVAIRGSYELDCEFTRRTNDDSLLFIIPVGVASVGIVMSHAHGAANGLHLVGGRDTKDLPDKSGAVVRPGKLINGQRYRLHVEVTQSADRAGIKAALDGKRFINWTGSVSQLSVGAYQTVFCPQAVGVSVQELVADIHTLELMLRKGGQGYQLGDDWKNPLTVVADAPPKNIAGQCLTWKEKKNRKYFISDKPMNFADAQRLAAQLQGRLLTISSAEEEAFMLEECRGIKVWMSGWRYSGSDVPRDERNRPFRFTGRWAPDDPGLSAWATQVGIHTASSNSRGWHKLPPDFQLHACIEWGEEYSDDK